jgi:PKD repeat protein
MKKIFIYISLCFAMTYTSCKPQEEEKIALPAAPTASFTFKAGKDANHYVFTNTTPGAFLSQWDLGNGTKSELSTLEGYFPYKGDYEVTLTAFNKGGYGSSKQKITIAQDDPNACFGAVALLSNCSSRTWKLQPEVGAMTVGTPGLTQVYWASPIAEVTGRACHFNDEFKFNSKGEFEYDNKGDFWGDADGNGNIIPAGGGPKVGCNDATAWKAPYNVWGSGKHKYTVAGDQLTLSGDGAWMGLYKVGTNGEVNTPQKSVTFKIIELTDKKLVIAAVYSALEWRFTYIAS